MLLPTLPTLLSFTGLFLLAASAFRVPDFIERDPKVKWTNDDRTVIVPLDTPGLPLRKWNNATGQFAQIARSSVIVLNFTMSRDNSTLLLQGQPFLPLSDANLPPGIWARQIPHLERRALDRLVEDGYFNPEIQMPLFWAPVGLSYDRLVTPRDNASNARFTHLYTLILDIIGATFLPKEVGAREGDMTLLDVRIQKQIVLHVADQNMRPSRAPATAFEIRRAYLRKRPEDFVPVMPHTPEDCTLRSWRCPDLDGPPYYRYVWFHEFSDNGRIGSLRHFLLQALTAIKTFFSNIYAIIITASLGVVVLMSIIISAYRMLTQPRGHYRPLKSGEDGSTHLSCDRDDPESHEHVESSKYYDTNPDEIEGNSSALSGAADPLR